MGEEREQNTLRNRNPGEPTRYYRQRIARSLSRAKAVKLEGEDFGSWVEKQGEKGILSAYLGWRDRYGANFSGNFQGVDLEEGAAMVNENEGINSFIVAIQGTRGKSISMSRVMLFIDKSLRTLEHSGVNVRFKGDFKMWCIEQMSETRALGPKAEELKKVN